MCFPLLFQEQRAEAEASLKAKLILETSAQDLRKAKKKIEKQKTMYANLRADYECVSEVVQEVQEAEKEEVGLQIKDLKAKGTPVTEDITVSSASSSFRIKVNPTPLPRHHHNPIPNPTSNPYPNP